MIYRLPISLQVWAISSFECRNKKSMQVSTCSILRKELKSLGAFPGLASASNTRKCKGAEEAGRESTSAVPGALGTPIPAACTWPAAQKPRSNRMRDKLSHSNGITCTQSSHQRAMWNGTKHGIIADHFCSTWQTTNAVLPSPMWHITTTRRKEKGDLWHS